MVQGQKKIRICTIVLSILFSLLFGSSAYAAKQSTQPVSGLVVTQLDQKVKVSWEKRGKRTYQLQILKPNVQLLKSVKVKKGECKEKRCAETFNSSLFTNGTTYTVRVRIIKTTKQKQSKWRKKKFTFEEETVVAPTLSTSLENTSFDAPVWVFLIDDGEEQPAVSSESGGQLRLGRFDSTDPTQVSWTTVADESEIEGGSIADHWHIFAHGYHWIVFSTTGGTVSYLAQFDTEFNRISLQVVANNDEVEDSKGGTSGIVTNDMFMVEEPNGVTVGHFVPGTGHRLYRYTADAELQSTKMIGGNEYVHSNGSSALMTDDGFTLFASEHLDPSTLGRLFRIDFNEDWEPQSVVTLLEGESHNFSMGSGVFFDNGYYALTVRDIDFNNPGTFVADGDIVQYIFHPDNTVESSRVLFEDEGYRPHTELIGNQLYTVWDEQDASQIHVDTVTF